MRWLLKNGNGVGLAGEEKRYFAQNPSLSKPKPAQAEL